MRRVAVVGRPGVLERGTDGVLDRAVARRCDERLRPPLLDEQARDPEAVARVLPERVAREIDPSGGQDRQMLGCQRAAQEQPLVLPQFEQR